MFFARLFTSRLRQTKQKCIHVLEKSLTLYTRCDAGVKYAPLFLWILRNSSFFLQQSFYVYFWTYASPYFFHLFRPKASWCQSFLFKVIYPTSLWIPYALFLLLVAVICFAHISLSCRVTSPTSLFLLLSVIILICWKIYWQVSQFPCHRS